MPRIASPKVEDCELLRDGNDLFVLVAGREIARRRGSGWIALELNWFVRDHHDEYTDGVIVEFYKQRFDIVHGFRMGR